MTIETCSEEQTSRLGYLLGELLQSPMTILLQGDLGAGKSVLARSLARGLGIPEEVPITSPTFTLMNHYSARFDLYHFDLYRLLDVDELIEIGFDDFAYSDGVALVEWPERLDNREFDHLLVSLVRLSADKRRIELQARGESPHLLLCHLERELIAAKS
ncbi:tRNA (adenosine(37)-N6)-threonylcarbamoyltransferase complex ATPase subunit type 1 TsaE [Geopsychrobacter electrodiphilus]|uniref:tRNA (adenosine(37)-N6)-threonylcarbamoyltransferase complex ATPase subunit type 1 TsaE n=1 Tax=Geopsychrobacter electrodiphilus TaxID=225196 RepID=UPI0003A6FBE4|nr:tRNA (adenosine(37)-N6)-threonylcarbamoyltransferase complex ATPase subunit type 1 TsaE [Geopsychrobacter electrodiphilus]